MPDQPPGYQRHRDAAIWPQLVEEVGPASLLVLIGAEMSARLRALIDPEDIWQETLVFAWSERDRFEWLGVKAFRAWLLQIARNRIRDAAAAAARAKRGAGRAAIPFSVLAPGASASSMLPPGSSTPSRVASHRERSRAMQAALAELADEHRDVVRLYLFEELTMEEVAARLGLRLAAAWYRFRKGCEVYERELRRRGVKSTTTAR